GRDIVLDAERMPFPLPTQQDGFPDIAWAETRLYYRGFLGHEAAHVNQGMITNLLPFNQASSQPNPGDVTRQILRCFGEEVQRQDLFPRLQKLRLRRRSELEKPTEQVKEAGAEHVSLRIATLSSRLWGEKPVDAWRASERLSANRAKERAALSTPKSSNIASQYTVGSLFMRRAAAQRPATGFCPTVFGTLALAYPALLPEPGEAPVEWVRRCAVLTTGEFLDHAMLNRYDRTYLALLSHGEGPPPGIELADWQAGVWPNPDSTLAVPNRLRTRRKPLGAAARGGLPTPTGSSSVKR
ncbi:MAG: hypothetical protein ACRDTD_30725, partial [Pseudonocardiaceae bacterium]